MSCFLEFLGDLDLLLDVVTDLGGETGLLLKRLGIWDGGRNRENTGVG